MSEERITILITLNVGKGIPELLKELSKELAERVESDEAFTKSYECFMDDVAETCYFMKCYPDSDALMSHLENIGADLGPILASAPLSELLVLGQVSEEAADVLSGFNAKIIPLYAGFQR